ncbi:MAG: hypothetical protein C6I01_04145 [Epsilonproteobacteria bacterium]|nr:hypothetical protein [Campylobacterota bacterium]
MAPFLRENIAKKGSISPILKGKWKFFSLFFLYFGANFFRRPPLEKSKKIFLDKKELIDYNSLHKKLI